MIDLGFGLYRHEMQRIRRAERQGRQVAPIPRPRRYLLQVTFLYALLLAGSLLFGFPARAHAETVPTASWRIDSVALPTVFELEDEAHTYSYEVRAADVTSGELKPGAVTILDTLPRGLEVKSILLAVGLADGTQTNAPSLCETEESEPEVQTVACTVPNKLEGEPTAREMIALRIAVKVPAAAAGPLVNEASVAGAGGGFADTVSENEAAKEKIAPAGFAYLRSELIGADGNPAAQAGSHPYSYITDFALDSQLDRDGQPVPARGDLRDLRVSLPPGLLGDPTAIEACSQQKFAEVQAIGNLSLNRCPAASVVGVLDTLVEGNRKVVPIYNLAPPPGMPAQLGLHVGPYPFFIDTELGPGPSFPIITTVRNSTEIERPLAGRVTIWGVPGEASHDRQRGGSCLNVFGISIGSCTLGEGQTVKPFLREPTGCSDPLIGVGAFNTWNLAFPFNEKATVLPPREGCQLLGFDPTFAARPDTAGADSPTGLHVQIGIAQNEDPEALAAPDLAALSVTLPAGLSVNPSSANGLAGCSEAEIGLENNQPPRCPDASKIGSVRATTPLLDHPVSGAVYLATQTANPFGSLIALYVTVDDPISGTVIKLAGDASPNPITGQISSSFAQLPQFPLQSLETDFFSGPRAPLRTPATCGTYTTAAALTPRSAPGSGPAAARTDSFAVSSDPAGGPCAPGPGDLPFAPTLAAGSTIPLGGSYTPFTTALTRSDGSQELQGLTVKLPPGMAARFAGTPYCPESGIAQADARSNPGQGAAELAAPSCPAESRIGTVTVGAGAGPSPYYTDGKVYLAGPYKGAPLSLEVITPAIAGPFDLGVVAVRAALYVDEETARGTVVSDPLPSMLQGIPLDVRSIAVAIDKDRFTLNPTGCDATEVSGQALSTLGRSAAISDRFQLGGCAALQYKPDLYLKLKGGTRRNTHPSLRAVLTQPEGQANSRKIQVVLPPSEFIDPQRVGNPCTRPQFAAEECPKISELGTARVFTPLFEDPLEGKVYFRSNGGAREIPDMVLDLRGQIHIVSVGWVDSVVRKGTEISRVRTTLATVPDAPIEKAVIKLKGGKEGVIVNSRNLCRHRYRASVKMDAQNGRLHDFRPPVHNDCHAKKKHKKQKAKQSKRHRRVGKKRRGSS